MTVLAGDDCECTKPGDLVRMVAGELAARGFTVSGPDSEESERLTVALARDMHCEVSVSDYGCVLWYWWPPVGDCADPATVIRLVLRALGHAAKNQDDAATGRASDLPLRGAAGRALRAAGLDVYLEVYDDQTFFEVCAEIVVTNADDPGRGEVRVDDHGGIVWQRWYDDLETGGARRITQELAGVLTEAAGR